MYSVLFNLKMGQIVCLFTLDLLSIEFSLARTVFFEPKDSNARNAKKRQTEISTRRRLNAEGGREAHRHSSLPQMNEEEDLPALIEPSHTSRLECQSPLMSVSRTRKCSANS